MNRQAKLTLAALAVPALALIATSAEAQHAPLPQKLLTAQSAYLVNDSGDVKAFDRFYQELKKWNRLAIVDSQTDASVVMVLTTNSQYSVTVVSGSNVGAQFLGSAVSVPGERLWLRVYDPSGVSLWSDSTDKWITSGHAPSKLVSNLKKRFPAR